MRFDQLGGVGEGIPMWNGFWKITAMVGVIGVGSYAAYQAHQGMNTPVAKVADDSQNDVAQTDETSLPVEKSPSDDFSESEPIKLTDLAKSKATAANARKTLRAKAEVANSLFDELDEPPEKPASKKNSAATKSEPKLQPVKQTVQVDPRNDEDEAVKKLSPRDRAKMAKLAMNNRSDAKSDRQPIRQVSGSTDEEEMQDAETESKPAAVVDSFYDDTQADAAKEAAAASEPNVTEATSPEPAKVQAFTDTDFDSDPPPIQSKRAKKKSEKRLDSASEASSAPPFDDATSNSPAEQPAKTSNEAATEPAALELGAPEPIAAPTEPEPVKFDETSAPESLQKLPQAPASSFEDDVPAKTSIPTRNRMPALPEPPETDLLNDRPVKKRSTSPKRTQYDRITPVDETDMVGDGIAGDASLRGLQQPRLTIEKVAQQQAVLDQPLVYSIIVKNTGTIDAHNIVIEDRIPKGTELQGTSPQAELAGKRLIWNQKLLKPNEEKKFSIKVIPKQEGPIGSVARVYFGTEVTAEIVVSAPQLEFTVKAPREVRLGQRFDLVFNLKNIGTVDATNVIVQDLVPDILKADAGDDIECPVGKLAPNESREIVLSVTASKTGSVTNVANLRADSGIKQAQESKIDVVGEVLVLTRSGQNRLYVERPAVFTNSIKNEGNQRAESVRISEVVPAGMEFDSASDGGRYDSNLRAVVWTLGPLPPEGNKQVTVKYVPKETGVHPAKITATGAAGSTAAVNSSVEVVGKPELQMETLSATGVVTLGERITSRFQLNNNGTAAATNVQLHIKLPAELRLISVKGAKFQQKGNEVWFESISELAPHTKAAYELVLEPAEEADAQIVLEISADHLNKPGRRIETIQIARDALK